MTGFATAVIHDDTVLVLEIRSVRSPDLIDAVLAGRIDQDRLTLSVHPDMAEALSRKLLELSTQVRASRRPPQSRPS
jgi:hypothetical protein